MTKHEDIGEAYQVLSLNAGEVDTHERSGREWRTAYVKERVEGAMYLGKEGLAEDEQANKKYHGGPDKALCVYPAEHYGFWKLQLGLELDVAAFGENVTLEGLVEERACIGDTFDWGEAVIQISEPREPCANIARRWGVSGLTQQVRESGFTGWYMRVLEPAEVGADEPWVLVERPHPEFSVARLNRLLDEPGRDLEAVRRLAELDVLGEAWREKFGG
ncbi:MAG: MOSC domain-containing protein [Myxococcota bacterium]